MRKTDRRAFLAAFGPLVATATLPNLLAVRTFAAQSAAPSLIEAYNASGQELFRRFASGPGNIVFSPYSIGTALAMALAGARGETEREMARVLELTAGRLAIAEANAKALAILNSYDTSAAPPACRQGSRLNGDRCEAPPSPGGICPFPATREGEFCVAPADRPPSAKLRVADALMLTRGSAVSAEYVALLEGKYAAEVFRDAGLDDVNAWVGRKTEGKIDKILDSLNPMATAVLLNAVYFKAAWADAFSKQATREEAFRLSPLQQVRVPLMRKQASFALVTRPGYRAIRLPYAIRALGMIVVLPLAADGLPAVTAALDGKELAATAAALRDAAPQPVSLALPRFKVEFKTNLVPLLQEAGLTLAFDARRADFSGMTGRPADQERIAIDQIVHRAVIEVQEEGTEAAAATAIGFARSSAATSPEQFRVDRPFLYYVVDDATGAVLFQGRVLDPR